MHRPTAMISHRARSMINSQHTMFNKKKKKKKMKKKKEMSICSVGSLIFSLNSCLIRPASHVLWNPIILILCVSPHPHSLDKLFQCSIFVLLFVTQLRQDVAQSRWIRGSGRLPPWTI